MKKLLLGFVFLTILTGCRQSNNSNIESSSINEITTYKESIKDGKVKIDGISYDIQSVVKLSYTYDNNGNVVEKVFKKDESEMRVDFLYKNNQIIEEKIYSNDALTLTIYYHYEDGLLIENKTVYKGLEVCTEYSYGDKTRTLTYYNSDGSIDYIATEYLDEDGKMLKGVNTTADGEVICTTTMYYENDLLIKSIRKTNDGAINTFNKEYNNLGDKIMEYKIFSSGNENHLIANFYDIEYNEDLLPKTVINYQVESPISEENIRD